MFDFNLPVFAIRDFDRLRIDCKLEARQKAHSQQPIHALTEGALGIRLDDDSDIIGLKRAQLDRCGSPPLAFGDTVRRVQSDGAVLIDLHIGLLRERSLQRHERCAGVQDEIAPDSVDRDRNFTTLLGRESVKTSSLVVAATWHLPFAV